MKMRVAQIVVVLYMISGFFFSVAFAFEGSFRQTIKMAGEVIGEFNVAIKGDSVYSESELGGLKTILIKNETGAYSYRPSEKAAIKIPDTAIPNTFNQFFNYESYLDKVNAARIKTETLRGKKCNVYEYSDQETQLPTRVWVSIEDKFPIQIEAESTPGPMLIEFFDLKLNEAVSGDLFTIPEDTEILDFMSGLAAA